MMPKREASGSEDQRISVFLEAKKSWVRVHRIQLFSLYFIGKGKEWGT
jgi:hypothetical protein